MIPVATFATTVIGIGRQHRSGAATARHKGLVYAQLSLIWIDVNPSSNVLGMADLKRSKG